MRWTQSDKSENKEATFNIYHITDMKRKENMMKLFQNSTTVKSI